MSSTLVFPNVSDLSGYWSIKDEINSCSIYIGRQFIESANGYEVLMGADCVFLPSRIKAWRPTPDGIMFVDLNGNAQLFMAKDEHCYSSVIDGQVVSMKRREGVIIPGNEKGKKSE